MNPGRFDVEKVIASCVATVSPLAQDGVRLGYEVDGVGEAFTDEARVRQMVINLLSNAVKFTARGEVQVDCKMQISKCKFQIEGGDTGVREVEMLEIAVSDTGKGIPEDELPTIFDEYRQVKGSDSTVQKGTGLGLSITKKFAELLGGTIGVQSQIGKGSTFTVRIPANYRGDTK